MRGPGTNLKTQYALQTVIYLARQEPLQVVSVSEIASAVAISPKFLEDILGALRAAGLVQSRRGKEGGYQLISNPAALSVLQVVHALEGPMTAVPHEAGAPIARVAAQALNRALEVATALLDELTVDQLVAEARHLETELATPYMYYL